MIIHGAELSRQPTESSEVTKHCFNTPKLGAGYTVIDNSSFLKNNLKKRKKEFFILLGLKT